MPYSHLAKFFPLGFALILEDYALFCTGLKIHVVFCGVFVLDWRFTGTALPWRYTFLCVLFLAPTLTWFALQGIYCGVFFYYYFWTLVTRKLQPSGEQLRKWLDVEVARVKGVARATQQVRGQFKWKEPNEYVQIPPSPWHHGSVT